MFSYFQNKKLQWLSIVSILSMVALLCFQGYWLYNGYRNTHDKFVETAKAALQEACDKEQAIQNQINASSVKNIQITQKDSSTQTSSVLHMRMEEIEGINLHRLDSLFRETLAEKGLNVNFVLEATSFNKNNAVRTIGEHKKSEIKVVANNIHFTSINVNQSEGSDANKNMSLAANMSMNINMNNELAAAYLQFTPLTIFQQMAWTLAASILLFAVILYCLLSQLRVIRQQKTAAQMKNDFIANFTHELKTPIAVVYAALDHVERNPLQTETAIETGKMQLKRLSESVEKILSLSVEEQGRLALHREETILEAWLTSLIAPFRLKTGKNIAFDLFVDPPNANVCVDKTHFSNALNNIIDNAIKYSGEQVHIIISCTQTTHRTRIVIRDNGIGIAEEDLRRIFDRFYRVKQTSEKVKGFGLGLNYAKTIVELHGGTIDAKSILGKGSSFIIELTSDRK